MVAYLNGTSELTESGGMSELTMNVKYGSPSDGFNAGKESRENFQHTHYVSSLARSLRSVLT